MSDRIHFEVDTEAGRLRLLCNAHQFNHLASWLRQEADIAPTLITIPATEIRTISVELVTEDESPPSVGKQLASIGCAIVLGLGVISSLVGLMTMVNWALK